MVAGAVPLQQAREPTCGQADNMAHMHVHAPALAAVCAARPTRNGSAPVDTESLSSAALHRSVSTCRGEGGGGESRVTLAGLHA